MERVKRGEENIMVLMVSFVRKAWISLVVIIIAIVMIILGAYFNSQSYWASRADVSLYNQGVETYNLTSDLLPATDDRPAEQPMVRAAAYFQQAAAESNNDIIKALALYNMGTFMGNEGLTYLDGETPLFVITEAIGKLSESIRFDPDNEAAKYNLEFLEKVQETLQPSGGSAVAQKVAGSLGGLTGYASGMIYKGY